MSKFDRNRMGDRMLDLAGGAGEALRRIGPKVQGVVGTGAGLGIAKTAGRIGLKVARRNPVIAAATVAGAGLLWYAAKKRAKRAEEESSTIEGSAQRVDARRADAAEGQGSTVRSDRGATGEPVFQAGVMHRDERFADRPYERSTVHFDADADRPMPPDATPPPYDSPRYRR